MEISQRGRIALAIAIVAIGGYFWLKPDPEYALAVKTHLINACADKGGKAGSDVLIKRDLTGDGQGDLLINHKGYTCADGSKSQLCEGEQCMVFIYVKNEKDQFYLRTNFYDIYMRIGPEDPPVISGAYQTGKVYDLQWNGSEFARVSETTP